MDTVVSSTNPSMLDLNSTMQINYLRFLKDNPRFECIYTEKSTKLRDFVREIEELFLLSKFYPISNQRDWTKRRSLDRQSVRSLEEVASLTKTDLQGVLAREKKLPGESWNGFSRLTRRRRTRRCPPPSSLPVLAVLVFHARFSLATTLFSRNPRKLTREYFVFKGSAREGPVCRRRQKKVDGRGCWEKRDSSGLPLYSRYSFLLLPFSFFLSFSVVIMNFVVDVINVD